MTNVKLRIRGNIVHPIFNQAKAKFQNDLWWWIDYRLCLHQYKLGFYPVVDHLLELANE